MCNGKNTCSVDATNQVFTDPCRGTYKYLSVNYKCVKDGNAPGSYTEAPNKTCRGEKINLKKCKDPSECESHCTRHKKCVAYMFVNGKCTTFKSLSGYHVQR